MFTKILIANRGEIACRVIKSARAMGIKTVAVYSDADRDAMHVQMADDAVHLGPPPATESYLLADKIIEACKATGAQAVHPGYGFLSERASFCTALEAAGIVFIGPKERAIEAMGDKITSKKIAAEAGVSTVPGHMGLIEDADDAIKIAKQIGYPVMIKASAGGGGKGMRVAYTDEEARDGFERSKSEAASSFGDDRIFIEKFVEQPRHIEIQVLADGHGNCIYLGERECSIQRRNQKVVEEAPSPFLDEATRAAMGKQSVELAKAVDYQSAGTVEFIVDKDRNFYFLEMNTRLQVEHPVTELITGIDLVEQMIRIADGEKLAIKQDDVVLNGWAMESRIYAEDPYRNFLPSIGRLTRYAPPEAEASDTRIVRNDTGVSEGSEISMFYDPMIAKLCTWAPTRTEAIGAMRDSLDRFQLDGIGHNVPFLSALMAHDRFVSGDISTNFIAEEFPDGFEAPTPSRDQADILTLVGLTIEHMRKDRLDRMSGRLAPHRGGFRKQWTVTTGDVVSDVQVSAAEFFDDKLSMSVSLDGKPPVDIITTYRLGERIWQGVVDGVSVYAQVKPVPNGVRLIWRGLDVPVKVYSPRLAELAAMMPERAVPDTSKMLLCPMPGLLVSLSVAEGDSVQAGQVLAVVEAMKMENALRAERDGVVSKINGEAGQTFAVDEVILEFE